MAHEIEELDGAAYALQPAWHGLGTVIDHLMTADEASAAAGLDWEVGLEPVYDRYGQEIGGHSADIRWSVRLDLDERDVRRYLGQVTADYAIVQNRDLFKVCEAICGEGAARFESALSMRNGRVVAVVVNLHEPFMVKDEEVRPFFVATTGHDGSRRVDLLYTSVRVVCMNTLNMALDSTKHHAKLSHVGRVQDRAMVAAECLASGREYFEAQRVAFTNMAEQEIDAAFREAYLRCLFPAGESKASLTCAKKNRAFVADLFEGGQAGAYSDACHGTVFGLYQAAVEYFDHHTSKECASDERRAEQLLLGEGTIARRKQHAFELAAKGIKVRDAVFAGE